MVGMYLYANIRQLHNKSAENYDFLHFCCAIVEADQMKMSSREIYLAQSVNNSACIYRT